MPLPPPSDHIQADLVEERGLASALSPVSTSLHVSKPRQDQHKYEEKHTHTHKSQTTKNGDKEEILRSRKKRQLLTKETKVTANFPKETMEIRRQWKRSLKTTCSTHGLLGVLINLFNF